MSLKKTKFMAKEGKAICKDNENTRIISYEDEIIVNKIKKEELKEQREKEIAYKYQLKQEKIAETKEELSGIFEINSLDTNGLIILYSLMILTLLSLFTFSMIEAIFSVIAIVTFLFINKKCGFKYYLFNETDNILLWNITQCLQDFSEYKIKYDLKESYKIILKTIFPAFLISLILFYSNNIIYLITSSLTFIFLFIAFTYRDFSYITTKANILLKVSTIGCIVKSLIYFLFTKSFSIDFINISISIICLFMLLLKNIELYEPED